MAIHSTRDYDYRMEPGSITVYGEDSRYGKDTIYETPTLYYRVGVPRFFKVPESLDDKFVIVDSTNENRLDLIAHDHYNNSKLWWVIAYANDLDQPFILPVGTELRIPSIGSIYGNGGIL